MTGGTCNRAVTGCVATAMAQVMWYHRNTKPLWFNWSIMPPTIAPSGTCNPSPGEQMLGILMRQCGDAVNMNYGPDESGAYAPNVEGALQNDFNYSTQTDRRQWNANTVISEINANRPVIVDGGSHMWVCHGYRKETYSSSPTVCWEYKFFLMNWGWRGQSDGFFREGNFVPQSGLDFNHDKAITLVFP